MWPCLLQLPGEHVHYRGVLDGRDDNVASTCVLRQCDDVNVVPARVTLDCRPFDATFGAEHIKPLRYQRLLVRMFQDFASRTGTFRTMSTNSGWPSKGGRWQRVLQPDDPQVPGSFLSQQVHLIALRVCDLPFPRRSGGGGRGRGVLSSWRTITSREGSVLYIMRSSRSIAWRASGFGQRYLRTRPKSL